MPSASKNIQIFIGEKMNVCPPAYIRRQCLLFVANCPQGVCVLYELRRVFATHKDVTAHRLYSLRVFGLAEVCFGK